MGAIALRLTGDARAPSDATLWMLWVLAPYRRATLPTLRRALTTPLTRGAVGVQGTGDDGASAVAATPDAASDVLSEALRAHAACLRSPAAPRVVAAGLAWDAARAGGSTTALAARRALALGARASADHVAARVLETAEVELSRHVRRAPDRAVAASLTLSKAAERARQRDLEEIEAAAKALQERTAQKTALHVLSEWMEWAALRSQCEKLAREGGAEARRTVFARVYHAACNYAVWLFNKRGEKLLAHAVFRWLLAQGELVGDAEAVKLLTKNVAAGDGS
jgi:hypothetical protein